MGYGPGDVSQINPFLLRLLLVLVLHHSYRTITETLGFPPSLLGRPDTLFLLLERKQVQSTPVPCYRLSPHRAVWPLAVIASVEVGGQQALNTGEAVALFSLRGVYKSQS